MLRNKVCLIYIYILYIVDSCSADMQPSEYNETNLFLSLNSRLTELQVQQERHVKLIEGLAKETDLQTLREELKAIKVDIQSLRADNQFLRADFQSLRSEFELQKKSNIDSLGPEQERLRITDLGSNADFKALKAEQERLVNESNKHNSWFNPRDCTEAKFSGIYDIILPNYSKEPFKVVCDTNIQGGGWTVFLRRKDGSGEFYRDWNAYKNGFGDMDGEFFLGLDKIHALTAEKTQELLVLLEDFEGAERFEFYDKFAIGSEEEQYILHTLGNANGTAGDSLNYHRNRKFTTFDRDNDTREGNCAKDSSGAWWYGNCLNSNLAGKYKENSYQKGVNWRHFRGDEYSLKKAVMMLRPKK